MRGSLYLVETVQVCVARCLANIDLEEKYKYIISVGITRINSKLAKLFAMKTIQIHVKFSYTELDCWAWYKIRLAKPRVRGKKMKILNSILNDMLDYNINICIQCKYVLICPIECREKKG